MKNLLNLGKALNKAEQKSINGGNGITIGNSFCIRNSECYELWPSGENGRLIYHQGECINGVCDHSPYVD